MADNQREIKVGELILGRGATDVTFTAEVGKGVDNPKIRYSIVEDVWQYYDGEEWHTFASKELLDDELALKANSQDVANALLLKAGLQYVDDELLLKADLQYVDDELALKANIESPNLTGDPKAPTQGTASNSTSIANTAFVKTAIDNLDASLNPRINSAEGRLDGAEGRLDAIEADGSLSTHIGDDATHGVTGKIVGTQNVQTLTNKTINADLNTLSNLKPADFKSGTVVTDLSDPVADHLSFPSALATKNALANFGAGNVDGPASSTDSAIALYDGVTGKVLKNSSVTVDSDGAITAGSLWLGSNSQLLSSTGALSLGSGGVITRAMGHFNAYGIVTSNTTTNSTSTGEDAVVSTPTRKVLRFTNGSLESILEIGAGLNSQELVLINSTGKEIFLKTDGNISSPDGSATKINNGSITSLLYDNTSGKWVISAGSGSVSVKPSVVVAEENIDWSQGFVFYKDLTANTTFTQSNVVDGKTVSIVIKNTGAGAYTLDMPSGILKSGDFPTSLGTGKTIVVTLMSSGGVVVAVATGEME